MARLGSRLFGASCVSHVPPNNRLPRRASQDRREYMALSVRQLKAIRVLRFYSAVFPGRQCPLFLFLCGGEDGNSKYVCRAHTERHIRSNPALQAIVTVKPEILLDRYSDIVGKMNLLELEAIIAELSDSVLLFDESEGPLCELGAFSMSPQIKDILTACIPARFRGSRSFAIQGPVKLIEDCDSKLSNVFYLDIDCPFSSAELLEYFLSFESTVRYFKKHRINRDKDQVDLGSFCRECLDLAAIFAPITDEDLLEVYKCFKGFESFNFSFNAVEKRPRGFSYQVVLAYLASTDLISYDPKTHLIDIHKEPPGYFMLSMARRKEIQTLRAELLSFKRKSGKEIESVYCQDDGK